MRKTGYKDFSMSGVEVSFAESQLGMSDKYSLNEDLIGNIKIAQAEGMILL